MASTDKKMSENSDQMVEDKTEYRQGRGNFYRELSVFWRSVVCLCLKGCRKEPRGDPGYWPAF